MKRKLFKSLYLTLFYLVVRTIAAFIMEEAITNNFIFENITIAVFNGLLFGFLSHFLFKKTAMPLIKTFVKFPEVPLALEAGEEVLKEDFGTIKSTEQKAHDKWFFNQ